MVTPADEKIESLERGTLTPTSEDQWLDTRVRYVTSTEIGALFNASPYITRYQLWKQKYNLLRSDFEDNDRMKWGRRLESSIAHGYAEDYDVKVEPFKDFMFLDRFRIGASFDFRITSLDRPELLEIKNVDWLIYKRQWTETQAPLHIQLQVQHQLLVSGYRVANIVALVGGNDLRVIRVERSVDVCRAIIKRVMEFWKTIENGECPEPDYPDDAEYVIGENSNSIPGKHYTGDSSGLILNHIAAYQSAKDEENAAAGKKDSARAEIFKLMQDAEVFESGNVSFTAKVNKRGTRLLNIKE